jgi:hypothetical protein
MISSKDAVILDCAVIFAVSCVVIFGDRLTSYMSLLKTQRCSRLSFICTYKTVKARFWPWLSGKGPQTFQVVPSSPGSGVFGTHEGPDIK